MRHTVVLSDIHLSEAEPGTGLWMRYRQRAFSPDSELAALFTEIRRRVRGDELTVVLNGDIFDFDAPRVIAQESVFHDLPRDAEHAVPMAARIVDDHPELVEALGRVLADGHTIVLISGNHDVQLTLSEVRAAVAERVLAAAARVVAERREGEPATPEERAAMQGRLLFRAWFHKTDDGIVIEHGNQYDPYCSFRYPMAPFGRDPKTIKPTMGSLAARLMASRMGYFNPHVEVSFMLSTWGYMRHWARYYLFSRRSLAFAWASGAVRTLLELVRTRDPERRERRRANIAASARETGVPVATVARHARLFATPVDDTLSRVLRELWLDRVGLCFLAIAAAVVWAFWRSASAALGLLLAPALLLVYELVLPKIPLGDNWQRVAKAARKVAKVHRARAVIFGHTHHPEGSWENGVFFGNTGSWSAAYHDLACTQPVFQERPLVWLVSGAPEAALEGGLVAWKDGRLELRLTDGRPVSDEAALQTGGMLGRPVPVAAPAAPSRGLPWDMPSAPAAFSTSAAGAAPSCPAG